MAVNFALFFFIIFVSTILGFRTKIVAFDERYCNRRGAICCENMYEKIEQFWCVLCKQELDEGANLADDEMEAFTKYKKTAAMKDSQAGPLSMSACAPPFHTTHPLHSSSPDTSRKKTNV